MPINSRNKGKSGELEAYKLLNLWAQPVCEHLGVPPLDIHRNQDQTRAGGYDLVGAPWLAIEVKRQETVNLPAWWRQAVRQAGPDQTPLLMWRVNRGKWTARIRSGVVVGTVAVQLDVDLPTDEFKTWFQHSVYQALSYTQNGR